MGEVEKRREEKKGKKKKNREREREMPQICVPEQTLDGGGPKVTFGKVV